jgi:hypothetical protein
MAPRGTPPALARFRRAPGPQEQTPSSKWRRCDARSDTTHAAEPLRDRNRREGTILTEDAMPEIEYAVDIWDLSGTDGRPNAEQLLEHLRNFAEEGWELVSLSFNIDLVRHGPSHLLVLKRAGG